MLDSQIRAMRTTSILSGGHSRGASFLRHNTGQGRTTQDVDGAAVTGVDQRKVQKGGCVIRQTKHTTNTK